METGIQKKFDVYTKKCLNIFQKRISFPLWIPACAGMTGSVRCYSSESWNLLSVKIRVNQWLKIKYVSESCLSLILALMLVFMCGCEHRVKKNQFLFGTVADITVVARTPNDEKALDSAFEAMKSTDSMMSVYNSSSEVSKINQNAGQSAVKVSQDIFAVIEKAIEFSQLSDGAFDVSIRPIVDLWGFGTEKNHVPSDIEIAQNLRLVDYKKIILDGSNKTVKLAMEGMKLDLGAIAVGYAVDKALGVLIEKGVKNALINGGGEIYALGSPREKGMASRYTASKKAWRNFRHNRLEK